MWWKQGDNYTRAPLAKAQNNIVAANLELRQIGDAKRAFSEAVSLDAEYAIPHFNLAMIAELEGDESEREHRLRCAAALGYSQSVIDSFHRNTGSILARFEGASDSRADHDAGS